MNENFVVAHFNGSQSGFAECGPYVDQWFESRQEAEVFAKNLEARAKDAGWYNRVVVWTADEYYANSQSN